MPKLEPPDAFYASAASGWRDLGNLAEAQAELEKISAANREHPDVLILEWDILAEARDWTAAIEVAEKLVRNHPRRSEGWIKRSFALHELKRTQEAWDRLVPARSRFPKESLIPYNLACYACQLGHDDEAFGLLLQAFEIGDSSELRKMALDDPDLLPLRKSIKELRPTA